MVLSPLAWSKWEVPRLLSIYSTLSHSVNIHQFFGVFADGTSHYAVMEDVSDSGVYLLQHALSNRKIAETSRIQKLRLCYEIALVVAYLHSVNIIVKVISESSIYVREIRGELIPVISNLEQARQVSARLVSHSDDMISLYLIRTTLVMTNDMILPNMDRSRTKVLFIQWIRICGGRALSQKRMTLILSLGTLLYQILRDDPLPSEFNASTILEQFTNETDPSIKHLVGGCLAIRPSSRLTAFEVAQRFLDQYNDKCAKIEDQAIHTLVAKCRKMIHARRVDHSKPPETLLSESDVILLLHYMDSWDDPGSTLRLAPEVCFLIGAGILWEIIDADLVRVGPTVIGRETRSPKGNILKSQN